jgi:YesN/AraC family two-component response regulator
MTKVDRNKIISLWNSRATVVEITRLFPHKPWHIRKEIKIMLAEGIIKPRSRKRMLIEKMREQYDSGNTDIYELAKMFQITPRTASEYLRIKGHKRKRPEHNYKKRELNEKALMIISEIEKKERTLSEISRDFGVTRQYVKQLSERSNE